MDIKRHIGRDKNTGARLVVVFLQLPDDPENCLVVYSDMLPDRFHDNLMEVVDGADAQSNLDLYAVLARHMFWHGEVMLSTLHTERFLKKLPIDNVLMTPTTTQQIPLRTIISNIPNANKTNDAKTENSVNTEVDSIASGEQYVAIEGDNLQIAANLMIEAEMLIATAEEKRAEAIALDPSLKPKPKRRASPTPPKKAATNKTASTAKT